MHLRVTPENSLKAHEEEAKKKKKERKVLCSLNMAQNRQNLHEFNLETFSLKANPHRPLSLAEKDLPCPRKIYLQRVEFQAENILIRAADLGKLNEGVLDAASEGHGLTQQRGVIPEFILQQDTEIRQNPCGVSTLCTTGSKDTSDRDWSKEALGAQGKES